MIKVRFLHQHDAFEQYCEAERIAGATGSNAPVYDAELPAVPREGDGVELPAWYYPHMCVVTHVHWLLTDEIPADVIVVLETKEVDGVPIELTI